MTVFRPWWSHAVMACGLAVLLGAATQLGAQERPPDRIVPTNAVVISGYGTVGQSYQPSGGESAEPSAFQTSLSPVFLFQFQDFILFEAELEFELEDGATATNLEYAQADIMVSDQLTLVVGKFLLPFGVFGERIHPTWINKLATMPPIYGHAGGGFGAAPIMTIPRDVGAMARAAFSAGKLQFGLNAYMTNGYQIEGGHEEGEEEESSQRAVFRSAQLNEEFEIPEIELFATSGDVTNNKMIGGRFDIFLPPIFEVNISTFTGKYDPNDELTMKGFNLAGEVRQGDFEARGEYIATWQDFESEDEGILQLKRSGFYSQLAYRSGPWQPVVRYTKIFDDRAGTESMLTAATQTAVGVDYWITPSVAVMASYEFNREDAFTLDNDRFNLHMALGF
jgi:porin-like protein